MPFRTLGTWLGLCGTRAPTPAPVDDEVLFTFGKDEITLSQLREGVVATAAVGGGKTSTVLTEVPLAFLQRGWPEAGCLWLTMKPDEVDRAVAVARMAGREDDLVLVGPGRPARCDLLSIEAQQCQDPDGTAQLLDVMMDTASRKDSHDGERFWRDAAQHLIRMGLTCLMLARERCSLLNLYRLLTSMAPTLDVSRRPVWPPESYCRACLAKAFASGESLDLALCGEYLTRTYPAMSDRMQSSISTIALTTVSRFIVGPTAPLVSAEEGTVSPLDVLAGKVVVMAYPVQVGAESARMMQLMWKLMVIRAALRRPITRDLRDVIIVADECQNFFMPDVDAMAMAVSRQSRLTQINAFQNVPLLYAALGGGPKAVQEVNAWYANQRTKFIGSNDCPTTNAMHAELLGQHRGQMFGGGGGQRRPYNPLDDLMGTSGGGASASWQEHWEPKLRPEELSQLRTGGPRNAFEVDMVLFQGGRVFSTGETFRRVVWKQRV